VRRLWLLAAIAGLALGAARAGPGPPGGSQAERLAELRKQVDDAEAAYRKAASAYKEGDPDGPIDKLWEAYSRRNDENVPKIVDVVREDPKTGAACEALVWVVASPRNVQMPTSWEAVELLRDHHATNPKVGRACASIGSYGSWQHTATLSLLRAVREKNPDRDARGNATFGLARQTNGRAAYLQFRKEGDPKAELQEAERLYVEVTEKYADCPNQLRGKGTLGEQAEAELRELRTLAIGKVAPEIAGEDIDGKPMKLSDYRGKVVVLDFWGHW
jgi:hypothetical protein